MLSALHALEKPGQQQSAFLHLILILVVCMFVFLLFRLTWEGA